ncbi:MAG: hypothetical protein PHC97_03450 [Patescibacteria group bacterium]|nr:hypothetical protein [Patescibacteria group bacterium]
MSDKEEESDQNFREAVRKYRQAVVDSFYAMVGHEPDTEAARKMIFKIFQESDKFIRPGLFLIVWDVLSEEEPPHDCDVVDPREASARLNDSLKNRMISLLRDLAKYLPK